MGLLTLPFRLPVLPVKAFLRLADLLREQADQELHDPAAVRHKLEEAAEARDSGAASDEEVSRIESEAVGRLVEPAPAQPEDDQPDQEG